MSDTPHAPQDGEFREQLRLLLADRHSPEAAALFQVLLKYIHRRVHAVSRRCGRGMPASEVEEIVAEVLLQLMSGGIARFRGNSLPELMAFVRTVCDRTTWRAARKQEKERLALAEAPEAIEDWSAVPASPDDVELEPDSPLGEADQTYLRSLLRAGSKAELARRAGVSRAAVTQRVQRIRGRISELSTRDRMAHDVWMKMEAREALDEL